MLRLKKALSLHLHLLDIATPRHIALQPLLLETSGVVEVEED